MQKALAMGIAALVLSATSSFAADMAVRARRAPPPPIVEPEYNWSGYYVGVVGGGATGSSEHEFSGDTHGRFDLNGGLFGGTLGVNWQAGQYVYGIEGAVSWTSISGSTTGVPSSCVGGICRTENSWLGTARVRLGWEANRALFYVTGGAAFGDVQGIERHFDSGTTTRTGWTAGFGVEYAYSRDWRWKVEYLHVDLGNDVTYAASLGLPHNVHFEAEVFRVGLNNMLNWGVMR